MHLLLTSTGDGVASPQPMPEMRRETAPDPYRLREIAAGPLPCMDDADRLRAASKELQRQNTLLDRLETLEQVMRSYLGPSWPPNMQTGQRVRAWADEIAAMLKAHRQA